jgi:hypothetical protein
MRLVNATQSDRQRIRDAEVIDGPNPHDAEAQAQRLAELEEIVERLRHDRDVDGFRRETELLREIATLRREAIQDRALYGENRTSIMNQPDWGNFWLSALQMWPCGVLLCGFTYLIFLLASVFAGSWLAWLIGLFAFGAGCQALTCFAIPFAHLRRLT